MHYRKDITKPYWYVSYQRLNKVGIYIRMIYIVASYLCNKLYYKKIFLLLAVECPRGCPNGLNGAVGDKGERGPKGFAGSKGLKGFKGPPGNQGVGGLPGSPGDKGRTGRRGVRGPQGLRGLPGAAGPAGPAGPPGPSNNCPEYDGVDFDKVES